ncbi:roles in filamentous growth, cell polarity, and cellular elongation [Scheffersomyces coipomensis]|uniref:roles in filamentous growth, cell polarity, and cellular elongation n=1 Tax=Scheffersomyces coipomensis TaxID=1788519 RepID=UPI00315D51BB
MTEHWVVDVTGVERQNYIVAVGYIFIISNIILVKFYKPLNNLLLHGKSISNKAINDSTTKTTFLKSIVDQAVTLTVPKSWFTHYYVVFLVLCSSIQLFPTYVDVVHNDLVTFKNIKLIHYIMWIQSLRRVIESYTITKFTSKSTMNFSHYFVGLAHYVLISINCFTNLSLYKDYTSSIFQSLTLVDIVLLISFTLLSIDQFSSHYHLSTLKKYSIPHKFHWVSSQHYLDEILIYTVILIFSLKHGFNQVCWFNQLNFILAWIFVVINLSISSIDNYKWYKLKFGDEFKLKWAIIPGIL